MANELVSVLLDGECSASDLRSLLDDAAASPALMQQWSRMSLVRDAMAGIPVQRFSTLDPDRFCAGIMAQLGEMAPADVPADSIADSPVRSNVIPLPLRAAQLPAAAPRPRRRALSISPRMMKPRVWAAAASVTLVALAGGRSWIVNGTQPAAAISPIDIAANPDPRLGGDFRPAAESNGNAFALTPVSVHYSLSGVGEANETRWARLDPEAGLRVALADRYHLHIDRSIAGLSSYGRLASTAVSYETMGDSH